MHSTATEEAQLAYYHHHHLHHHQPQQTIYDNPYSNQMHYDEQRHHLEVLHHNQHHHHLQQHQPSDQFNQYHHQQDYYPPQPQQPQLQHVYMASTTTPQIAVADSFSDTSRLQPTLDLPLGVACSSSGEPLSPMASIDCPHIAPEIPSSVKVEAPSQSPAISSSTNCWPQALSGAEFGIEATTLQVNKLESANLPQGQQQRGQHQPTKSTGIGNQSTSCSPSPSSSLPTSSISFFGGLQSPLNESVFSTGSPANSIQSYQESIVGLSPNPSSSATAPIGKTRRRKTTTASKQSKPDRTTRGQIVDASAIASSTSTSTSTSSTSSINGTSGSNGIVQSPLVIPTIKRVRRVKANDRERSRMHNLNEALLRLRKHLPYEKDESKMTKIETLRSAQEYIQALSNLLLESSKPSNALQIKT